MKTTVVIIFFVFGSLCSVIAQNFIIDAQHPNDTLQIEQADYNFDGNMDYRIQNAEFAIKYDYFIYNSLSKTYEKDTLLSSMDWVNFDFTNKKFFGNINTQISELIRQSDKYENINGELILTERSICRNKFQNSERSDCDFYELQNGVLVYVYTLQGAE